jgi:putative thioredoxin
MDFQKDILEKSYEKPVVVDFWAEWCGPCRMLGPVIEQLAEEQKERWELVKIDTEAHQEIARQYKVMSIPNVKMFYQGEVVAEFAGALPRHAIQEWLDEHIPDPGMIALDELIGSGKQVPDPELIEKLQHFLETEGDSKEVRLALARHLAFDEPEKAVGLVEDFKIGDPDFDEAEDIRQLAILFSADLSKGSTVGQLLEAARAAFQGKDPETGIQKIIEAASIDKNYQGDLPRKSAIAFFRLWGKEHELTKRYRRRFDMVLY